MTTLRSALLLAALSFLPARPAHAGLLDSPPPAVVGERGTVVYRMGPVHYDPGRVDTVVSCTNLGDAPAAVALEVFDENDVLRGMASRAAVPGGDTVTFATSSGPGEDAIVALAGLPPLDHGKARVSATTSGLSCVAKNRMLGADGRLKERPLELLKKIVSGG